MREYAREMISLIAMHWPDQVDVMQKCPVLRVRLLQDVGCQFRSHCNADAFRTLCKGSRARLTLLVSIANGTFKFKGFLVGRIADLARARKKRFANPRREPPTAKSGGATAAVEMFLIKRDCSTENTDSERQAFNASESLVRFD